jgi:hypothetical protein
MNYAKVIQLADKFAEEAEKLTSISDLAEEFIIKLAEYKYANEPPPEAKLEDLEGIDEQTRAEIKFNDKHKNEEYQPFDKAHNPPGGVSSEKTWNRAKKAVKPYWSKYKNPWSTVVKVFKDMGGTFKKRKQKK